MASQKRAFLVHGYGARPDNHWFPWLKQELEARYFKVFAPAMPNVAEPKLSDWLSHIKEWVGRPSGETFFVGHSLGALAIVRYLETLGDSTKIGGAVLVAGFSGAIDIQELKDFYAVPIDVSKVRRFSDRLVSIISDNDDTVSLEKGLEFSRLLRAKTMVLRGRGHFCKEDGVTSLPEVLESVLALAS